MPSNRNMPPPEAEAQDAAQTPDEMSEPGEEAPRSQGGAKDILVLGAMGLVAVAAVFGLHLQAGMTLGMATIWGVMLYFGLVSLHVTLRGSERSKKMQRKVRDLEEEVEQFRAMQGRAAERINAQLRPRHSAPPAARPRPAAPVTAATAIATPAPVALPPISGGARRAGVGGAVASPAMASNDKSNLVWHDGAKDPVGAQPGAGGTERSSRRAGGAALAGARAPMQNTGSVRSAGTARVSQEATPATLVRAAVQDGEEPTVAAPLPGPAEMAPLPEPKKKKPIQTWQSRLALPAPTSEQPDQQTSGPRDDAGPADGGSDETPIVTSVLPVAPPQRQSGDMNAGDALAGTGNTDLGLTAGALAGSDLPVETPRGDAAADLTQPWPESTSDPAGPEKAPRISGQRTGNDGAAAPAESIAVPPPLPPPAAGDDEISRSVEALRSTAGEMAEAGSRAPASTPAAPPPANATAPAPVFGDAHLPPPDRSDGPVLIAATRSDSAGKINETAAEACSGDAIVEALASERFEVIVEPILGLADRKARHFEVSMRLKTMTGQSLGKQVYDTVLADNGLRPLVDAAKLTSGTKLAERLLDNGKQASVFSNYAGESLAHDIFLDKLAEMLNTHENLSGYLVLAFTQADVRGFGDAHWDTLDTMLELGFRFALEDLTDFDMDFSELKAHGFDFVKLDAAVFVHGLPMADAEVPAADLCRYLADVGQTLIVGHIDDELALGKVLGFGVLLGQGAMFGAPRALAPASLDRPKDAAA